MDRGFWLPPGYRRLPAYDGYYIDAEAVYATGDIYADWDRFLNGVCSRLSAEIPAMRKICDWTLSPAGNGRFILTADDLIQVIAEDADSYVAVYAIIPESGKASAKAKRQLSKVLKQLEAILTSQYPDHVWRRENSQHVRRVG